ncbi:MAG: RHS repeat-associated core domain-containing protein [Terracidiphilus sp.]
MTYYPASNPNNIKVLNANTTGSGQIGTLDTTTLPNGSYWIHLEATNASGNLEYSLILVTVAGNYKPGRVTATVTDLVVPATGLAINIQRTYDSLNAGTSGDFGYGWSLGINVNLTVDPKGDVTFTLGGQRKTFYFTPQQEGFSPLMGYILPWYFPIYTPEPGLYGTLADSGSGCYPVLDLLTADGYCIGGGQYNPTTYIYTDPNGTSYTISAAGNLQSIQDRSGNGLTITANGITSTTGLSVPFVRDAQNRITQITDPQGHIYSYTYDTSGNLATVTYPATAQAVTCPGAPASNTSQYTYHTELAFPYNHYYESGTDGRCNPLPITAFYDSTTDGGNSALDGRLLSVTDAFSNTTSYSYILSTTSIINGASVLNTGVTTITYPADASGNVGTATMIYDSYGDLLSSTDPLNHTTTNVYDANHNLISTTDPLGHTTSATYDGSGNKTSSTYPATPTSNNTTSYTSYNQYSEPISTTDELGDVRTFNYDANYNPQSVTDSIGTLASFIFNSNQTLQAGAIGYDIGLNPAMASQFTYDASGNMASRTDALGRTTSYTYNSLGQKLSMTTPTPTTITGGPASTTNYTYDALGDLTQTAAPLSRTTSSTYDANSNKISDTDARGYTTSYVYDALNRLVETDYPDGSAKKRSFDFRNNVLTAADQAGNVTLNAYDLAGRLISVTRGYGSSTPSATTYAYDAASRKISETDALGHSTSFTYDAAGRLVALAGVKGNFAYAYDDAGDRISQTDGNSNTTQFAYDARKRLTKTINPDSTTIVNAYDGPGNLAQVTDQAGAAVQYTYDAANQLKTVVQLNHPDPSRNTNLYGYDPLGNLTGLTDANIHTTQNMFDVLNQLTQKTLRDQTLTETRTYDAAGNLQTLTHFNGVTTTYTYDAINQLVTRTTPGEPTVTYAYTPTGKRATMSDGSGNTTYSYDPLDRLTTKAAPAGVLSYSYDGASNLASISSNHVNGILVQFAYDELNRLTSVVDNRLQGNQTTTYTYDPASNVATVTAPNGLQTTLNYDSLNRITSLSTPISSYTYTLGATGNKIGAVEGNGRTLTWNYDGIYRLTNETITSDSSNNNGSAAYGLDPVGNRLSLNSSLPGINSGSFTFNPDDQISSETYDLDGDVLSTGGNTYTYDSQNHMTSANNGAVRMIYDGDGYRVAKIVNGVTTQYLVDDLNPTGLPQVVEEVVNGAVTRQYTYGLQRISESQILNSAWTTSFYGYDGAGSVRQLINSAGVVTDEYEYDAYGNSFTKSGTTPNNYLYRGEQYDSDLGLYYLRAIYYNPSTGRFLSRDPLDGNANDPATLHKYLYVGGDPVNWIDPSGRAELFETVLIEGGSKRGVEDVVLSTLGLVIRKCFLNIAVSIGTIVAYERHPDLLEGGLAY